MISPLGGGSASSKYDGAHSGGTGAGSKRLVAARVVLGKSLFGIRTAADNGGRVIVNEEIPLPNTAARMSPADNAVEQPTSASIRDGRVGLDALVDFGPPSDARVIEN